jgi:lysozyme
MNISQEGIALIKRFEGCELEAYLDSVGIPTIAYGRIKNVEMGDTCTQEQAEKWLEEELPEYEGYINDMVKVELEQCQFDALCSWVYNLGPNNLKESTLLKVLNEGNYSSVPAEIKRWNKAGGKVLQGLMRRREAEALLFENKEWFDV